MEYINKLPFLLSVFATLLVGTISKVYSMEPKTIYIRMMISMVIFFLLGKYVRKTINKIFIEVENKVKQNSVEHLEEYAKNSKNVDNKTREEQETANKIEYIVGDQNQEILPYFYQRIS